MKNTLFIHRIRRNLLSISELQDMDYAISFIDEKVLIWSTSLDIHSGKSDWCSRRRTVQIVRRIRFRTIRIF
jgi:hypothetical protein